MTTAFVILVLAGLTVAAWLSVEGWAIATGRKLITDVMRTTPRAVVGLIMFVVGALYGHFWWCDCG